MVERRAPVLATAHACAEQAAVALDEASHVRGAAERDRGPDVEPRAGLEEICRDVFAHDAQTRSPAEHAELVIVPRADNVGAGLDEHTHDSHVGVSGGAVHRRGVVGIVADAHVGTGVEQHADALDPVVPRRAVERRLSRAVNAARIEKIGMRLEQATELVRAAAASRGLDVGDGALHVVWPFVALLVLAHQQLERGVAEQLRQLMDRAAGLVDRPRMKAGIERPADGLHVTGARGLEDALAAALVDMRFELSPAREAVGACDTQLRIAEPGVGIVAPQRLQQALGLVTEVLEIGASGQLG